MRLRASYAEVAMSAWADFLAFQGIKRRWSMVGGLHVYRERESDPFYLRGMQ